MDQFSNALSTGISALVNATVVPLANLIGAMAGSGALFLVFAALWVAFGVGLVWSQGSLDATWTWIRALPLIAQAVLWLLFLPVTAGLWIWESTWPLILRFILVSGLAGWNLLVLLPRAAGR